jgi:hypothetical protein
MLYMNEWDIHEAVAQFRSHPVLSKATVLLLDLMTLTNAVSDGWPYWAKPCKAARQLQALIQRGEDRKFRDFDVPDVTMADLRRAVAPIKALLTREAKVFAGHRLTFPC